MIISVEEGNELAKSFISALCTSTIKNNHDETMRGFFANAVTYRFGCGSEGENASLNTLFKDIKDGYCTLTSFATHTKPFISVDTEQGKIVATFDLITNINGRMEGETNIVVDPHTHILTVNSDKKVVKWEGIWDQNDENWGKACPPIIAKLKKNGVEIPSELEAPLPMLITRAQGEEFAAKYMKAVSDGFLDNSHAVLCRDYVADNVSWDWSDGTKGTGTYEEMHSILAKTWGPMLSSWNFVDQNVSVDTVHGIVAVSFFGVGNITGGFKDENNPVPFNEAFILHLDENCKVTQSYAYWDNNNSTLQAAVNKVKARIEVTPTKVLERNSQACTDQIMAGQ